MAKLVENGCSLEGKAVNGSSRNPMSYKGLVRYNKANYHRFKAEFNVKAKITIQLDDSDKKIEESANCSMNDTLICEQALLHSKKNKFSSKIKEGMSATHGATIWSFSSQTNIKVTRSHSTIQNAIDKRKRKKFNLE